MDKTEHEFSLTTRAKLIMLAILLIFGVPILYAAWLQFQSQKPLIGGLMIGLFILFILVLFVATGYKIKISDSTLHRESLLGSTTLRFTEIDGSHFGSSWTNFYVQSGPNKIFVTQDFEDHENIIRHILNNVRSDRGLKDIELTGKADLIEQYT